MTDHTETDQDNGVGTSDATNTTAAAPVEAFFEEDREPRPEDIIERETRAKALYQDGLVLTEKSDNPIIAEVAAIANSDDLKVTQETIFAYETGSGPLYRFLGRLLTLGRHISESKQDVVRAAFKDLRALLTDEAALAKKEKRSVRGLKNIGIPILPIVNDEFIKSITDDNRHLYKVLTQFYFPNATSGLRARYYDVLYFAHKNEVDNFVTWVAGDHSYTERGNTVSGSGLIGAYRKIKALTKEVDPLASVKSDQELDNAFATNIKTTFAKPDWLDAKDNRFMILGQIVGDNVEVVNVTTTNLAVMKSTVRERHGSLFPSDFDYLSGDPLLKMRDAVKNLIKFVGPGELVMWQDDKSIYLMPTYEQWIDDGMPGVIKTDRAQHYAVVIDIYPMRDKKTKEWMRFPEYMQVLGDIEEESDIFPVGYVTIQIDKIAKFKGTPDFLWLNEDKTAFEFMGALWTSGDTKKTKLRTAADEARKRTRLQSCAPYGFKYITACKYYEDDIKKVGDRLSNDIDFSLARKEFRLWSEARTVSKLSPPKEIIICVKDGIIGAWYEPVHDKDGKIIYNADRQLVRIGSTHVPQIRGQWRVPVTQLKRVWELVTGPWAWMGPAYIDKVRYFKEPTLTITDAVAIMEHLPDQPFGHMNNLCSTNEHDDCLFTLQDAHDDEDPGEKVRMCVPLVLMCHSFWIYLFSETK